MKSIKNKILAILSGNSSSLSIDNNTFYKKFPIKLKVELVNKRIIISHLNEYAYFRISKAANSTVVSSLYYGETSHEIRSLHYLQKIKDEYYDRPSDLSRDQVSKLLNSYFKFTFVRNPYTRILSAYLDKIVNNEAEKRELVAIHLGKSKGSEVSFDDFLLYLESGGIDENGHWARQIDLIPIPLNKMDFIGRVENLQKDLDFTLSKIYNSCKPIISVREHSTSTSLLIKELAPETINRIYKLYESDFDSFHYPRKIFGS